MKTLKELTPRQQAAILELLVFGMYADAHLAVAEDERLHRFLADCGVADESAQRNVIHDAVSSLGRVAGNAEKKRAALMAITKELKEYDLAQLALARLEDLLIVDGGYSDREETCLKEIRELLQC